jgi:hypothetical protein
MREMPVCQPAGEVSGQYAPRVNAEEGKHSKAKATKTTTTTTAVVLKRTGKNQAGSQGS